MKNHIYLILGLLIILGSVFLFFTQTPTINNPTSILKINGTTIHVEEVKTPKAREEGLSNRDGLPDGRGMLFIFDTPDVYRFWMKDMKFAIDIVWIDENLRIVDIDKEATPDTFPQVFYPDQAIKYVLELPAGSSDKYHIEIGAVVQL